MALAHKHRGLHPFELGIAGLHNRGSKPLMISIISGLGIRREAKDFVNLHVRLENPVIVDIDAVAIGCTSLGANINV